MRKLPQIKGDVQFYDRFSTFMETCKTIALTEFHSLEKKVGTFERLAEIVDSFFRLVETEAVEHPFVNPEGRPLGVIMVTSDGGLSGGLDAKIAAEAINQLQSPLDRLIIVGRKGQGYAQKGGLTFVDFPGIQDDKRFSQAMELEDYIIDEVLSGKLGPIKVVYARPLSLIAHRIEVLSLLPCLENVPSSEAAIEEGSLILESTPKDVIEYLVYIWFGQKLFDVFGMSRLAEVAARFMHAEDSSQKINEINEQLKLEFFRARHEIVDQQMRELFAARA